MIGRIEKAQQLADRLENLTARAAIVAEKAPQQRATATAPVRSIFDRPRSSAAAPPAAALRQTTEEEAVAAAEALILRLSESEVLTSDEFVEPRTGTRDRANTRASTREWDRDRELDRAESRTSRRFDSLFEPRSAPASDPRSSVRPPVARRARPEPVEDARVDEPRREDLRPPVRLETRAGPRSRAQIDDDLFDAPSRGGRLRAFDGGLS